MKIPVGNSSMDTSEVTCCFVDKGLFLPIARRLAREFKKVYYWTPHEKSFRTVRDCIGDGFEEITRIDSPWRVKSECDLFVFPDNGFGGEQMELISQGYPVWGARDGDTIETKRGKFLELLATTDLPVPPHTAIKGMTELRVFLCDKEDKYVKTSQYRADWETLHFRNWRQDETELDVRAVRLGPWKELVTFYVFDQIDTEIEDGVDSYCIDGQFPKTVIHGMECKDKAYLGTFQKFSDLPEEVRCVNDAFGPVLADYQYRSLFSTEVRITKDGQSFFIDPTCRAGSPPSQVMCEMIANLGQIFWRGAHGTLVEPEPAAKFGVQALIRVDRSDWEIFDIDEEIDQWFKMPYAVRIDGRICVPPDTEGPSEIGWLVGIGDTIEESIKHLRHNAELLPDGVCCELHALSELLEEVHNAEDHGMPFTDQPVPDPKEVM